MEDLENAFKLNDEQHPVFNTRSTPNYNVPKVLRDQHNRLQKSTRGYFADLIMYEAVKAIQEDESLETIDERNLLPDEAIPMITVGNYVEIENIMRNLGVGMVPAVTYWYNEEIRFTAENIINYYF